MILIILAIKKMVNDFQLIAILENRRSKVLKNVTEKWRSIAIFQLPLAPISTYFSVIGIIQQTNESSEIVSK